MDQAPRLTQRHIGPLTVGEIGLGCMGMSAAYDWDQQDDARSTAVLRAAPDLGVTLIDTAAIYGPYRNEELVGAAFADGSRERVVLATKCGLVPDPSIPGPRAFRRDARPEAIRAECLASLRRLRVDVIDLYQLHRVDPAVPIEESWGELARLRDEGLVRAIGLSEATIDEVHRAASVAAIDSIQSELSLWTRHWVDDVLAWSTANDVAFLAYSPLGRGFLTGAIPADRRFADNDTRSVNPRFTPDALAANQSLAEAVAQIAGEVGATAAQVAIAWTLRLAPNVIPIPGTKRPERLIENVGAAAVHLTDDQFARLNALPPPAGDRY